MKAKCSYSRPIRGTWRSRKTSAKHLGVLLAEFVELPGDRGQVLDRVGRVRPGEVCGTEQPEALLGEGEEDVVF